MSGWRFNPVALLRGFLRPIDPMLLLLLGVLLGYAWVLMQSASPERLDNQLLHFGIALGAMWCMAWLKPSHMLNLALPLYAVGVVLLLGVEFFGEVSKGAQRWLDIGITRIQPSEIMKIAMPLMLAWYFQQREGQTRFVDFLIAGLLLVVPFGLILIQPDLGTSLLVAASGLYVIYFAGLSWKLIVPLVLAAVIGIGSIVAFGDTLCQPEVDWQVLREYQKQRVCTLLDPTRDPLGKGFHIIQSTIAIGSGGVSGKGWMEGTQTHLAFLPERHTDFIFAVLAEEFGLVGAVVLLATYLLLLIRGFTIAAFAPTHASRLLAGAVTMIFFTYAFVNMGMVSGILPVVGVPLPFVSYGGTALVTLCLGIGILMSIQRSRIAARSS
ncbi:SEDS family protein MrdB [Thauera humireducens]|jgi:rod shape determining protein RodA|uniref:Peptidoglycan glycosyltransferase MrdB n=1 Tax=Thauera humireducens TaxID=1134435 RepID=A0A127K7K9_9RHOO|nr:MULTISPECIES: rod shape-determining protein RodA [Thauera]AMO37939.1 rod shape-determining protein RodA [Thauera humireducens]ENO76662.1 rod shape-determining protein [Thauera sp. 63]CAH1746596.1 SEDS family protein MrdB [Thauera humireducens]